MALGPGEVAGGGGVLALLFALLKWVVPLARDWFGRGDDEPARALLQTAAAAASTAAANTALLMQDTGELKAAHSELKGKVDGIEKQASQVPVLVQEIKRAHDRLDEVAVWRKGIDAERRKEPERRLR